MSKKQGTLCILAAAALWSIIGLFVKLLTSLGLSSMQMVTARTVLALAMLVPAIAAKDRRLLFIAPRDWYLFFGTGILSMLFFNWCYFGSINASSVSVAAVLLYTAPIFVVLMSALLFGERLTKVKLMALAATFAGCVLVSGMLSQADAIGPRALLLGLGSGFGYALYSIFGRFALKKYSSLTVTLWSIAFAGAGSVIACAIGGELFLPAAAFSLSGFWGLLGMAALCCALPYILYTSGLTAVESGRASIMATIEPALATLIGVFVFSERLTALKGAGMLMILLSAVLLARE